MVIGRKKPFSLSLGGREKGNKYSFLSLSSQKFCFLATNLDEKRRFFNEKFKKICT